MSHEQARADIGAACDAGPGTYTHPCPPDRSSDPQRRVQWSDRRLRSSVASRGGCMARQSRDARPL